ncbi:hypothetical protein JCM13304A_17030 [Desulfothermus okinawensis JCM 13304]
MVKVADIELNTTQMLREFFIAKHRAISGINFGEAVLIFDKEKTKSDCDTLLDIWNNLYASQEYLPEDIGPEYLDIKIEDEQSKIPINYMVDKQKGKTYAKVVKNLLMDELGMTENMSENIIKEIKNWINPKKYPLEEVEVINPYYNDRQYTSKNGTFETLGEMLLLPSVNSTIYYGNADKPGLKDLFTVYSDDGKININTCKKFVLKSLILNDIDLDKINEYINNILKKRSDPFYKEALCNINWIKKNNLEYKDIDIPYNILTTKSTYFKIISTGIAGSYNCTIIRFVKRKNSKIKTIFQTEY